MIILLRHLLMTPSDQLPPSTYHDDSVERMNSHAAPPLDLAIIGRGIGGSPHPRHPASHIS